MSRNVLWWYALAREMEKVSELEGVVLGILWLNGPHTAYAIRQVFLRSASPQWASSAGTIYPLVQRLEHRNLIRSEARPTGRRQARKYILTPAGQRTLGRWIGPPLPDIAIDLPVDALRTRIWFLGAIPDAQRRAMVKEARRRVREHLQRLERDLAKKKAGADPFFFLASRAVVQMSRMRLAWLAEVESALPRINRRKS